MKTIGNNRVERILSVLVIAYGVYLSAVNLEDVLFFLYRIFYEGIDRQDFYWIGPAVKLLAGVFVLIFFASIVQVIAYFASGGMERKKRRWTSRELLAATIACYALMGEILRYFFILVVDIAVLCQYWEQLDWTVYLIGGTICLTFALFGILLLYYARTIAGWLLRRVERRSAKRERGLTPPPL